MLKREIGGCRMGIVLESKGWNSKIVGIFVRSLIWNNTAPITHYRKALAVIRIISYNQPVRNSVENTENTNGFR